MISAIIVGYNEEEFINSIIDELEKTKIEVTTIKRYSEVFYPWVGLALLLLIIELLLRKTGFAARESTTNFHFIFLARIRIICTSKPPPPS